MRIDPTAYNVIGTTIRLLMETELCDQVVVHTDAASRDGTFTISASRGDSHYQLCFSSTAIQFAKFDIATEMAVEIISCLLGDSPIASDIISQLRESGKS